MNFAVLPPEVTSAQMYTGAGSGPMLAAAASWAGLGDELGSAADSFSSVTSGLAGGPWQGPASAAMAAVATQYAQWLGASAAQATGMAAQADATAAIFEAAKAAITHPAAVTGNRLQLLSLVRSNLFGFNAPAIAATEGAYEEMWAQNVGALSGYHGAASAVAAELTPWQPLPSAQAAPATSFGGLNADTVAKIATKTQADVVAFGMYADSEVAIIQAANAAVLHGPPAQIPQRVVQAVRVDLGAAYGIAARAATFPDTVASDAISVLAGTDSSASPPTSPLPP